jgi:hypothetical protein
MISKVPVRVYLSSVCRYSYEKGIYTLLGSRYDALQYRYIGSHEYHTLLVQIFVYTFQIGTVCYQYYFSIVPVLYSMCSDCASMFEIVLFRLLTVLWCYININCYKNVYVSRYLPVLNRKM